MAAYEPVMIFFLKCQLCLLCEDLQVIPSCCSFLGLACCRLNSVVLHTE